MGAPHASPVTASAGTDLVDQARRLPGERHVLVRPLRLLDDTAASQGAEHTHGRGFHQAALLPPRQPHLEGRQGAIGSRHLGSVAR
ncbi:hypothetical protein [Streptomyces sp. NBC_00724]|uniref:hypothetical protein n=1 Tax=Streptomyces sp. NBC_00724 TaxID=2975812 RepID=UPI002ED3C594|nr:hypothetical protein OHB17_42600 [Streptomyces sp. NBC_00724]